MIYFVKKNHAKKNHAALNPSNPSNAGLTGIYLLGKRVWIRSQSQSWSRSLLCATGTSAPRRPGLDL